jgi:hypothetical protein
MPLAPRRVFKQFKYAMYFDGIDDLVYIRDNPSLRSRVFTVFIYAYITVWNRDQQGLFYKTGRAPGYAMFFEINAPAYGHRVRHQMRDMSTNVRYDYSVECPRFAWFSTALTYNGVEAISYLNASVMNIGRVSIDMSKNNNPISIGQPLGNSNPILIFMVQYYTRALTQNEIRQNHNNPLNPDRNGLVLWLNADPQYVKDIDGDGVPEWIDLSGFGNHGKIYGATLVQLVKTSARVLTPARVLPLR